MHSRWNGWRRKLIFGGSVGGEGTAAPPAVIPSRYTNATYGRYAELK
jgi:hypothetical protein